MNALRHAPESRRLGTILGALGTLLIVLAVFVAAALAGLRLAGFTPYVVLSDSMAPQYHAGDLVYVRAEDPERIDAGDVIACHTDARDALAVTEGPRPPVVLHRVASADRAGRTFTAKGDANPRADAEFVAYDQVVGTAAFAVPQLGHVSSLIANVLA